MAEKAEELPTTTSDPQVPFSVQHLVLEFGCETLLETDNESHPLW